jgi:hypothetical protein
MIGTNQTKYIKSNKHKIQKSATSFFLFVLLRLFVACCRQADAIVCNWLVLALCCGLFSLRLFFFLVSPANCIRKLLEKLFDIFTSLG